MLRKLVFVLVCLALMLGATSNTVIAGPPWPAQVTMPPNGEGLCTVWWIVWEDRDLGYWYPIPVFGTTSAVYQPITGIWNISCHFFVDFDDPAMATIAEVCSIAPDWFSCNTSTFKWKDWDCYLDEMITFDSLEVVNPSGNGLASCHFVP